MRVLLNKHGEKAVHTLSGIVAGKELLYIVGKHTHLVFHIKVFAHEGVINFTVEAHRVALLHIDISFRQIRTSVVGHQFYGFIEVCQGAVIHLDTLEHISHQVVILAVVRSSAEQAMSLINHSGGIVQLIVVADFAQK